MNIKFNFDKTNVQVGFENQFVVKDLTDKTLVKILMLKGEKGDAGSVKFTVVTELPTENIDESAIYLVPSDDPSTGNTYSEWLYVNGTWEKLGETPIEVDLTDYVKFTDYATANKGGVIKNGLGFEVSNAGFLQVVTYSYSDYNVITHRYPISKGTLENVITGKNLETANNKVISISSIPATVVLIEAIKL